MRSYSRGHSPPLQLWTSSPMTVCIVSWVSLKMPAIDPIRPIASDVGCNNY